MTYPTDWTDCGEAEPSDECAAAGYCDSHSTRPMTEHPANTLAEDDDMERYLWFGTPENPIRFQGES